MTLPAVNLQEIPFDRLVSDLFSDRLKQLNLKFRKKQKKPLYSGKFKSILLSLPSDKFYKTTVIRAINMAKILKSWPDFNQPVATW